MQTEQTYGQKLVRARFNPSNTTEVDAIKRDFSRLIDAINNHQYDGAIDENSDERDADFERLKGYTISYLESACMYAVKMLTTGK